MMWGIRMINFSYCFPWVIFGRPNEISGPNIEGEPLREFVYLDEVSLASLLASQKGEQTENITAKSEDSFLAEVGGKVATGASVTPSAEFTSKFQTTNSSALQTVRKSNAQSLFREFHKLNHLRKIQPHHYVKPAENILDLFNNKDGISSFKTSDLNRGDLVEFKVKLSASWIFQISTIITEFSEMFDESPSLFLDNVNFYDLYQAKNVNKIINKLLAGLVPIDGIVSDYSVLLNSDDEYITHNDAIGDLSIEKLPLKIVGVTQHIAYWKDIRQILFADNEFTVLCRISRTGIHNNWNPIKLADIFKEFAPDLANQIESASRVAMAHSDRETEKSIEPNGAQLLLALVRYKDIVLNGLKTPIAKDQVYALDKELSALDLNANSAEGQAIAFGQVGSMIEKITGREIEPEVALAAREEARDSLGLSLFPDLPSKTNDAVAAQPVIIENNRQRFLDVEVVAIYW